MSFFPPGGSSGGLSAFQTQTALALQNSFSFTGIPNNGHALLIVGEIGTNRAGQAGGFVGVQLNADSGANYFWEALGANNAVVASSNSTANTSIVFSTSGALGTDAAGFEILIPNYLGTTFVKKVLVHAWNEAGGSTATGYEVRASFWSGVQAITRVDIGASIAGSGQMTIGSTATLYVL